jgi:hypothetical protein
MKGTNQPLFQQDSAPPEATRKSDRKIIWLAGSPDLSPIEENVWDVIGTYEKYNDMGQLFLGF